MTQMRRHLYRPPRKHCVKEAHGEKKTMRKIAVLCCCLMLVGGCSEHDPILSGVRTPVFGTNEVKILNTDITNLPDSIDTKSATDCPYTQNSENIIMDNQGRKIFSGFPTNNSVASNQKPVCSHGYVYAGLTTGEVVKVAPNSKKVMWVADVFRRSNMTGGAAIVDIIAPLVINGDALYVGGLGDAFCRINTISGVKKWCATIGTAVPFIVSDNVTFVVGTDNYLYALRNSDGVAYWRTAIKKQVAPQYSDKIITVGDIKINAENGEIIK